MDPPPATQAPPLRSVDLRGLSWAARLASDYCLDPDRLAPFFVGLPGDERSVRSLIEARQKSPTSRADIADLVVRQLRARGAPAPAIAAAERLDAPGAVAIVTGQQAGLFGGPLFTLLKALTAIRLAHDISRDHGVPALPVFWVDAEDHDLAEIQSCQVLTEDLVLRRVSVRYPTDSGIPASTVILDDSVADAIDELRGTLQETEFTGGLLEQLQEAYRPGRSPVAAFCHWLDRVLGPSGLAVFDASDPAAKSLARGVFAHELDAPGTTSRLASAAGHALSGLGYHAQVTPAEDAVALFHLGQTRRPIRFQPPQREGFNIGEQEVSGAELRAEVNEHPQRFSPSVLLRPVVQDTLFPTIIYVSGPNELAYLAQLQDVYTHFGVPMPVIYPRVTATIVDRAALKFLDRFDVDFSSLQAQDESLLNSLLAGLLPDSVNEALDAAEQSVSERLAAVAEEVGAVDSTLVGMVGTTRGRMERDLKTLRSKVVQAAKRRDETLRRQFHRTRAQTFPDGQPQERAVGFIYFLNRHGPHLVDQLLNDLPPGLGQHWLLTV